MAEDEKGRTQRVSVEQHGFGGLLWIAAWLFTVGFLDLGFWRGVLALLLWPYFVGVELGAAAP